jgi:spore coat polysaccharide biosynthesis protein SpsF (cytidylyltransferase family)
MRSLQIMEPVHIILQARVDSMRLPGKALMPVAGIASAVLAARRASRDAAAGSLVVATADSPSCDPLAKAMTDAGVAVFRGSENDVLGRFAAATHGLPGNAIVVRMTADNVFPDSDFVQILVGALCDRNADIVGTQSATGLPYGLSGEAFRLAALRQAAMQTDEPYDREHVTPWLYRNARTTPFDSLDGAFDLGGLRCTLDTAQDYGRLQQVFEGVTDPVAIGWRDLVDRLAALPASARISG